MEFFDFNTFTQKITVYAPKVIAAIAILFIGLWIIRALTRTVKTTMEARDVDTTLRPFLTSIVNIGLKILLFLTVAGMFGIETASFIAVFGAIAFAVGMALQGSLGHFASGIMMLVIKPYQVGDWVTIHGQFGKVEALQIFNTILRTPANELIYVPNGKVTDDVIKNHTGEGEIIRIMTFGIGYGDDIDKARAVIKKVAAVCPYILQDRELRILVSELADSSVNFSVRPWVKAENYKTVYFYMMEHVKKAFDEEGISIPFPQMDIHQIKN